MIPKILFIDEKKEDDSEDFRYKKLEFRLKDYSHLIEFISDLELEYQTNDYDDEIIYNPNPSLEFRDAVFIHSSLNTPKYPEPVVNKAKSVHLNTEFSKFSNGRDDKANLRKENLIFNRNVHIYNFEKNGFELFIKFYSKTTRLEYYFLQYGKDAFLEKVKEIDRIYNKIVKYIVDKNTLDSKKLDANFMNIMRLANVYEDKQRLKKGIEIVSKITNVEDYIKLIDKYVKLVKDKSNSDQEILLNIIR